MLLPLKVGAFYTSVNSNTSFYLRKGLNLLINFYLDDHTLSNYTTYTQKICEKWQQKTSYGPKTIGGYFIS